jgi:hypothetical protein
MAGRVESEAVASVAHPGGLALTVAALAGLAGALGGPWAIGYRDRPAKEPFAYALPEGFEALPPDPAAPARQAWFHPPLGNTGLVPNMTLTHVNDMSVFDNDKLAQIAAGMPAFFAKSKMTWTLVRHASIRRHDGAFVGLLEGENVVGEEHYRSLQFSFPDNTGVSIVTANFPSGEALHWEPIFQASIEASRGIATRGTLTPFWIRAGFAGGMFVLAFYLTLAVGRGSPRTEPSKGPSPDEPGEA